MPRQPTVRSSRTANTITPITGEVVPQNKPGPKRKFEPWMCDKIKEAAGEGAHIDGMMCAIGIYSRDTWYRWIKEYPEFAEAVEESKIISKALHESIGFKGTLGLIKGFNSTAYAMIMNNKFPDEYKRGLAGGATTEVTINQLNLSSEDLQKKIAETSQILLNQGVDIQKLIGVKKDGTP